MSDVTVQQSKMQNHAAFLEGTHEFQADIEMLSNSALIGTILETVMLATNMRFAAVARVTADRWVACRTVDEVNFGLESGDEIEIESTFCQSVRDTSQRIMFSDTATDEVYAGHPIASKFGIVSYASMPIHRSDGTFFGTLCAIDTEARDVQHPRATAMLEMFAEIIGQSLEAEERLEAHEQMVAHERNLSRIQEEFVAVLGHDLRNPVAALDAGLRQLSSEPLTDKSKILLPLMRSSLRRMNDLIENIMLHAKERLGGGIRITAEPNAPLAEAITQVVEEVRAASPTHEITLDLGFDRALSCDAPRIAQAISNLLSNAVRYGTDGATICVEGQIDADGVCISVANKGADVPAGLRQDLFNPFKRGDHAAGEGLGLGLHIASTIATAHNGRIEVTSEGGLTTFSFRFPLLPEAIQTS
ncbi:GAF domain-containing sensor histidine kinase [Sulfitobacter guttiformis]|uniref:histidine kinase n=1 Tax=Sulfitobacter guttiformis TaxID=74349 RepID=A0A420DJ43_9RHOB|nr:GAF domain-containing sensor histidine kinase [Sulfitobacter guttiformis]KIN71971.1 Sensor histidine kinase [Sulfitobacter guttiformis KCTC 32187]RKE94232.1 phospho-acceptor domain-containing protein [Sulfitobacter guttiformis]